MCGIYCVYKQSRSCQLPFCAGPIFHFEMEIFLFTCSLSAQNLCVIKCVVVHASCMCVMLWIMGLTCTVVLMWNSHVMLNRGNIEYV